MAEVPISGGAGQAVQLGTRMFFKAGATTQGRATTADSGEPGVLGDEGTALTAQLPDELGAIWQTADAPFAMDIEVAPPTPGVLSDEGEVDGTLMFAPADRGEAAVYIAMQEIHTADGQILWDFTRPTQLDAADAGVLSGEGPLLQFPIRALPMQATTPEPGVLGIEGALGGVVGGLITRRVVQVLRAPLERSILGAIAQAEGEPGVYLVRNDLVPLDGADAWRGLLKREGGRVLLLIHGFTASVPLSFGESRRAWLASLAQELGYDAIIGYSHPTVSRDVLTNAKQLLERIPDDLRLDVDLLCHSRGGLVGRTLVELTPSEKLRVRRGVFCGSPLGGTVLASAKRWDQLVSLVINAASLAVTLTGAGVGFGVATKVLGQVLKAAAQFATELPGAQSMRPADEEGGEFIQQLNAAGDPALAEQVRYAVAASRFSVFNEQAGSFKQTLQALAAQAFIDLPNDIVVPTDSMSAIDMPQRAMLGDRSRTFAVSHFGYFDDEGVRAFIREQLRG